MLMELVGSFADEVDQILIPKLIREFGKKQRLERKGLIEKLLFPKYVMTYDPEVYEKAWDKLIFKGRMQALTGQSVGINKLVNDVICELKNEMS